MRVTLYKHDNGAALAYENGVLTATSKHGPSVRLEISKPDMLELALDMLAVFRGDVAEQSGAATANECLEALRLTDSAGERIRLVQDAITSLQADMYPERAALGFSVVLAACLKPCPDDFP